MRTGSLESMKEAKELLKVLAETELLFLECSLNFLIIHAKPNVRKKNNGEANSLYYQYAPLGYGQSTL